MNGGTDLQFMHDQGWCRVVVEIQSGSCWTSSSACSSWTPVSNLGDISAVFGCRFTWSTGRKQRGYGVGGRLICAVKDGSMMAVTGVSMRRWLQYFPLHPTLLLQTFVPSTSLSLSSSSDDENTRACSYLDIVTDFQEISSIMSHIQDASGPLVVIPVPSSAQNHLVMRL
ncbi:hypothetical protein Tco_0236618 [Tanacetum coccineum]